MEYSGSLPISLRGGRGAFGEGLRDGAPIGLGYLAVGFSVGIAARGAGLSAFQSFLASALCNASAGQHAGFMLIASGAGYLEIALMTLIVNARYLLMSCAMGARMAPSLSLGHRLGMAYDLSDELFAVAVARPGNLNPWYTYGAVLAAAPCWACGTALGALAGQLMPVCLTSAFSVALYGMFLAVIIPAARGDAIIGGLIAVSFASSYVVSEMPVFTALSFGTRTILLTLALSAGAAFFFPRKDEE